MAGLAAHRELATRFTLATHADDAAIRRLLRATPMPGAVTVGFEREPDYFRGTDLANGDDQTIVVHRGERLVCMGRCTRRRCWINGAPHRVGYLAELRLDGAARGRFAILREGYHFFHALQQDDPADLYFTSIAADNHRARRLLEAGARGLPAYHFLAELDTVLVAVPRHSNARALHLEPATEDHLPDLLRVLQAHGHRHQLAAVWTGEMLSSLSAHGLPLSSIFLLRDGGEVVVCGALWDQRNFRQTVIHGYRQPLSVARPLVNLASRMFGTPRLPAPAAVLAHAFLSPLAWVAGAETRVPDFIEATFSQARQAGVEFLTLALPAGDSRLTALRRRFSTRTWRSRLYRVDWPESGPRELGASVLPEVAFL